MPSPTISPDIDIGSDQQDDLEQSKLFNVVLLDDDDHTYDYVIEMLQTLLMKTIDEAYAHAKEVDATGRTIVMTCELEPAEFAQKQIHGYGADWRMPRSKGSMSAIIEPASA